MEYVQIRTTDGFRRLEIPNEVVAAGPVAVADFVAKPPAFAKYVEPLADDADEATAGAPEDPAPKPELNDAEQWLIEKGFVDRPDVIHPLDPAEPVVTRAPRRARNVDHPAMRPAQDDTPKES